MYGNLLRLQIKDPSGNVYQLRTKVGSLPTALSSGQQAYNVQGGGVNTASQALTMFSADLVPTGNSNTPSAPQWDAFWSNANLNAQQGSDGSGVRGCSTVPSSLQSAVQSTSTPLPLRFDLSALAGNGSTSDDAFDALAVCVAPTASSQASWTMWQPSYGTNSFGEDYNGFVYAMPGATLTQTTSTNGGIVWNEAVTPTAAAYVLEASDVKLVPSNTRATIGGTAYYVLGSRSMVISSSASNQGSAILNIQGRFLSQLSESSRNSSDGEQSMSQGDH